MKGKSTFTKTEADAIIALIREKLKSDTVKQKSIRNKIRRLGFYASDFGLGGGYTEHDFLRVVTVVRQQGSTHPVAQKKIINRTLQNQSEKAIPNQKTDISSINKGLQINGLAPVADKNSKVLILGTMPGVESLKQQAYYGHPRNLFWQLLSEVTGKGVPADYNSRKKFLLENKIALWDMCQVCTRPGSLDTDISEEVPNDIRSFITEHPSIKLIAFNGKKSAQLFAKYIQSVSGIKLLSLPSSSPANAGVSWEEKIREWSKLKTYIH